MSAATTIPCPHLRLAHDDMAGVRGYFRLVPGDCFCKECRHLVPAWWNRGRPVMVEDARDGDGDAGEGGGES